MLVLYFFYITFVYCIIFAYFINPFHFMIQAGTKKQKYEKISEKKMSTPIEVLCKVSYHYEMLCGKEHFIKIYFNIMHENLNYVATTYP